MLTHSAALNPSTMRLLLLSCLFLAIFASIGPVHSAPLSVRDSSNTELFRGKLFACKGFNCRVLFSKDQVTPELVKELRNNPDAVKDRNRTQDEAES